MENNMLDTEEKRYEYYLSLINKYGYQIPENVNKWLLENGFFTAPASTKFHGNFAGGLFLHSLAVFNRLISLTTCNKIKWQRAESPFIIGMFHDLCKCDQYIPVFKNNYETVEHDGKIEMRTEISGYEYNANTVLKGHGSKSVMILSQLLQLTEEEMLCIRYHMGAYEKEEWTEFDLAIHQYETVLWTHTADMLASKVDNI